MISNKLQLHSYFIFFFQFQIKKKDRRNSTDIQKTQMLCAFLHLTTFGMAILSRIFSQYVLVVVVVSLSAFECREPKSNVVSLIFMYHSPAIGRTKCSPFPMIFECRTSIRKSLRSLMLRFSILFKICKWGNSLIKKLNSLRLNFFHTYIDHIIIE